MGRRKLELKPIGDSSKRHTTFTKRRQGLTKKVREFCDKFDGEGAVLVYSKTGNGYFWGHPRCEPIIDRYISDHPSSSPSSDVLEPQEVHQQVVDEKIIDAETKIAASIGKGPIEWAKMMSDLEIEDLDCLADVAERIKQELAAECQSRTS